MPVNKAARFRFEIIDECLRNTKKKWSKAELLKYVNRRLELQFGDGQVISISQLRYDLENMQSEYGAPIEMYKSGKSYYYQYDDLNFSLKNIPVNEDEIMALNTAVDLLKQIKGFTITEEVAEIVHKLQSRYNFSVEAQKDIIIFENSDNLTGKDYLEDIYHAIVRKNVLKVYCSCPNSKIPEVVNIHPYLLKEYDEAWYVIGYCQESHELRAFELHRIKEIKISKLPYMPDVFLTRENYFKHIIGVSKPSEDIQTVRLLFSESKAQHILSSPIHASQEVIENHANGMIEISLKLIINQELVNLLLSFGCHVKVLSPKYLITELSGVVEKLLNYYHADQ